MTQIVVKYILHLCIFRHLKLEIALAIPASNDEKKNSYTSISGSWYATRPGSQRVNDLYVWPTRRLIIDGVQHLALYFKTLYPPVPHIFGFSFFISTLSTTFEIC